MKNRYKIFSFLSFFVLFHIQISSYAAIYVNHIGYLANEKKLFTTDNNSATTFQIINQSISVIYTGNLSTAGSDLGTCPWDSQCGLVMYSVQRSRVYPSSIDVPCLGWGN